MAGKRKNQTRPRHDLPVFERIRKSETIAASMARHADDQTRLKAHCREVARAAKAILSEDISPILEVLDKRLVDPNMFIWCAFAAYTPHDTLKLLIAQRDAARRMRKRMRALAAELAKMEREAHKQKFDGVSEEHAKALEDWAARITLPRIDAPTAMSIKTNATKPSKAAYLRNFMTRLAENHCTPGSVLAIEYKDGKQIPNRYDAVIARMASVVLGDEVTITEVRSARMGFRLTSRTLTEPHST